MNDDWGCWECGHQVGRVTTTDHDEDGNRIRRRKCVKCGGIWLTEERRLARVVRWGQRATHKIESQRRARAKQRRTCRLCGGRYAVGTWATHVRNSRHHSAWKARRAVELRDRNNAEMKWRYRNDPVYRQLQIEKARQRWPERRDRAKERAA